MPTSKSRSHWLIINKRSHQGIKISIRSLIEVKIVALALCILMVAPSIGAAVPLANQIDNLQKQLETKQNQAKQSKDKLASLSAELSSILEQYQQVKSDLAETNKLVSDNKRKLNSTIRQKIFYQHLLNNRTVFAYRYGNIYLLEVLLDTKDFRDLLIRLNFLSKVSQRDAQILSQTKRLNKEIQNRQYLLQTAKEKQAQLFQQLDSKQKEISALLDQQQQLINNLNTDINNLKSEKDKKEAELKKQQELAKQINQSTTNTPTPGKMTFPIPPPYSHGYSNSWGYPRADIPGGRHQGIDIFASKGTPVVAVVDGVIGKMFGKQRIGGYRLWVEGDNGFAYYYAHLNDDEGAASAYAPGIAPGVRVKAGQVIGYVGNSGDAKGTPYHLHFGMSYPLNTDNWINPYQFLVASDWLY